MTSNFDYFRFALSNYSLQVSSLTSAFLVQPHVSWHVD